MKTASLARSRPRQRGMTLVMALIMLVVLTLLALTSFNLGRSNLVVVSNMQHRDESIAAAHEVIEEAISSTAFFETPENILSKPCGEANSTCIDTNGDGKDDVKVSVPKPSCVKVAPIKQATELNLESEQDRLCAQGDSQSFGLVGAATGNSACANSVWEIHAVATEIDSNATVEVVQGVSVRVPADDVATSCPKS
jgi:Tfp pilus assembly protein PilX